MRRRPRLALCAVPLLLLAACSEGTWWGGDDEPPLPGERIPVMLLERELAADPRLADAPVRLPPPQRNQEWPQNGGLPTHVMHHLAAGDHLDLAWQAGIGTAPSDNTQMLARPVVAEGRIYVMDADATITAFDAQGGRQLWRVEPEDIEDEGGLLGGGLAFDGGWLFVSLSSGTVLALNAASGEEIWRQDLMLPLRAAPTVADGRLLLITADNQLYALDGETGQPLWRHAGFFEGAGLLGGPSPAVDGGVVVVPYSSAEVFGLLLDNGRPLWSDTVQRPRRTQALAQISDIDALPVIDGDRAYVASYGGQMAAIDLRQGIRSWDVDLASTETPWLAGQFIYVLTARNEIVCLLADNGGIRWVSPLPRLTDPEDPASTPILWTGPVLAGDRLLVAGSNQEALTVSPYNGEILGRIDLPGPVSVSPVVANGTIFLLTDNGQLLAYR